MSLTPVSSVGCSSRLAFRYPQFGKHRQLRHLVLRSLENTAPALLDVACSLKTSAMSLLGAVYALKITATGLLGLAGTLKIAVTGILSTRSKLLLSGFSRLAAAGLLAAGSKLEIIASDVRSVPFAV